MFATVVSVLVFFYLLVTSLVVYVKNPKNPINISLSATLLFIGGWLIAVAGLSSSLGSHITYGRSIFVIATLGLQSLYVFSYFIAASVNVRIRSLFRPLSSAPAGLLVTVLSFTPFVVSNVNSNGEGVLPTPIYGPLYLVFVLWALSIAIGSAILLVKAYRYSRGAQRGQMQTILYGVSLFVIFALTSNVILPLTTGNSGSVEYAPLSAVVLSFALSFAVLKHRFLDIRWIIARTIGYILSLVVLVATYVFIFYFIAGNIFTQFTSSFARQVLNVGLLVLISLTFTPVKKFFDKITNRFFFQDAYDTQAFFNQLNNVIVSTIELKELLKEASRVISSNIKSEYCLMHVRDAGFVMEQAYGNVNQDAIELNMSQVRHLVPHIPQKVIVADYLEEENHRALKKIMTKSGAAILIRLTADPKDPSQDRGYILLGAKRSGNFYSSHDLTILETLANELVIAIQNALRFEEIERFNATLQDKINNATKKLRNTNDKLRQLDQTKDDFISMASHQLRTPLTSVKGYVSMVLDGDAGEITPLQRKLLNQSYVSSQRMVYLISDLLNVSRLRTGKFLIEASPCNLAKIIKDEIEQLKDTAKGRNLELTFNKPEHFPTYMLDETKMRQVIMNFIDNAIYYTPSGGHIAVNLAEKQQTIEFTVTDDGIGVPRIEQHHLFTKFYRAHNARRARPDGTGLGLFMAKKVVVAQGGAITFRSREGHGSTFGFSFSKDLLQESPAKLN